MKVDFVFPYRKSSLDREKNLLLILEYYKSIPILGTKKIIVVEQDLESSLMVRGFDHFLAPSNSPFNRSWLFNLALKNSDADYIFYIDNDIVIPKEFILESLQLMGEGKYHFVKPFDCNKLYEVSYDSMKEYIQNTTPPEILKTRQHIILASAAFLIERKSAFWIKGMDERFEGWGGEDEAFSYKVNCCLRYNEMNNLAYHISHERSIWEQECHPNYQNILDILEREYRNVSCLKIQNLINKIDNKQIGLIDKYQKSLDIKNVP